MPTELAPTAPVRGPFVTHGGAWNVRATDDYAVLATRRDSYFNRTWDHFCSHQHAPDAVDSNYPGAVCNGEIAYFAHSLFTSYRQLGQPLYRDLFKDVLGMLLPEPSVKTSLPTAGRASLMRQTTENRSILHLLFAVPQKRGADATVWGTSQASVEIIEDLFPLENIECLVRLPETVQSVTLVPTGETLPFSAEGNAVKFTVPRLLCHQMVELRHAAS